MSVASARDRALEFAGLLRLMGPIEVSRFFGGAGLVKDGVQFAFVMKGTLYLRVDDDSRPIFEALGAAPFTYAGQSQAVRVASYYEVPDSVTEDADEFLRWATRACLAAVKAKLEPRRRPRLRA